MINNNFYLDLKRGAKAETLVTNWFRSRNYDVMDMTKNPAFWKKDIDLLVYDRDGTTYKFEVKGDWTIHRTGNVVLELTSKTGKETGWFNSTESSHLAFVDMEQKLCYIVRTHELREYVRKHPELSHVRLNGCDCILVNIHDCNLFQVIML